MTKRKFRRVVIQVEVLLPDCTPYNPASLAQVHHDITDGEASGQWEIKKDEEVDGKKMAKLLRKQASDPSFFQLDNNGNDET
jgi:hypothetical protein